jgi:hypothetical protein
MLSIAEGTRFRKELGSIFYEYIKIKHNDSPSKKTDFGLCHLAFSFLMYPPY